MKSILSICVFLMLFNVNGSAQESVNAYKYVIVPTSYNFLNGPDQYQINSLTKFLFEKLGFTTLMADSEFPEDLNNNRCLGLYADVEKHKAFLNTKLQVHLKDCNNKTVLSSSTGESREKEYDKVYNLALRDAFKSFDAINYTYQPISNGTSKSTSQISVADDESKAQEEIDRLKKQVEALKEKQVQDAVVVAQDLTVNPVENGYTITDASSKVLYHLVFSGKEDVYIVKGQDAIVYKMNNAWIISSANDAGVSMKTLNVKF